jgi:predicted nucleotidyltransferase
MRAYKPQLENLGSTLIQDLVRLVVEIASPRKIVLFGSRARGDCRPDSDIDLLIIKESDLPRPQRAIPIYSALARLPLEVDANVMVYTPQEVDDWSEVRGALVTTALREGRVLYEEDES